MSFRRDPDEEVGQLVSRMPTDLVSDIQANAHDDSLVKRMVKGWIARQNLVVDTRVMDKLADFLRAQKLVYDAASEAKRARHGHATIDRKLEREDEIADLEHEAGKARLTTGILRDVAKQRELADPRGPLYGIYQRLMNEALARRQTYHEFRETLERTSAADLEIFKQKPGVTAEAIEQRRLEHQELDRMFLADFADLLARGAGGTPGRGWPDSSAG